MSNAESNRFHFTNAGAALNMTVLNAVMSDFSYGVHAHDELALGVTLEGVQEFSCKGSRYRSEPGDVIVFNPGDAHNGNPGDHSPLRYTMLYLDPDEIFPLMGCAAGSDRTRFRISGTRLDDPVLRSLILRMNHLATRVERSTLESECCLYNIAERLVRREGLFTPGKRKTRRDALLLRVREFIHDNIGEDLAVDDLSRVAGMSKYHFIRLFRSQFGMTPHRYILNCRVNRVREALAAGSPPTRAAQDHGFFDVSHLNRHFKRAFGLTPARFQRQLTKG